MKLVALKLSALIGLFLGFSQAQANTIFYGTLQYPKNKIVIQVSGPSTPIKGRNSFDLHFFDKSGVALTSVALSDISGTTEMTSMEMGKERIVFRPGQEPHALKGVFNFSMKSLKPDDWKVTLVYKGEAQSFLTTVP